MIFKAPVGAQVYFPPLSPAANWATTAPATLGYNPARIDSLYNYLARSNSKGFILLKDGKIVLEKYYGTFTKDSNHVWNSAGKTLTGFCVGLAQQEGKLSINDKSSDIMGNGWTTEPLAKERLITVRHQLTMTSGINDSTPGSLNLDCSAPNCLTYLRDAGTRWAYHNAVYTLLDSVLERSTGQNLNTYFITKVRSKTGMNGLFIPIDNKVIYISTPRSMARFGLLILNKGTWGTTPILTDTAYLRQATTTSNPYNLSYGYLWWLNGKASYMSPQLRQVFGGMYAPNAPADMYSALGKDGQILSVAPSQGLVLVRMGDKPGAAQSGLVPISYVNDVWRYVSALSTPTAIGTPLPRPALAPNPATTYFYVDAPQPSGFILDALGRHVQSVHTNRVNIAGLPLGVYTLQLQGYSAVRFLKQ